MAGEVKTWREAAAGAGANIASASTTAQQGARCGIPTFSAFDRKVDLTYETHGKSVDWEPSTYALIRAWVRNGAGPPPEPERQVWTPVELPKPDPLPAELKSMPAHTSECFSSSYNAKPQPPEVAHLYKAAWLSTHRHFCKFKTQQRKRHSKRFAKLVDAALKGQHELQCPRPPPSTLTLQFGLGAPAGAYPTPAGMAFPFPGAAPSLQGFSSAMPYPSPAQRPPFSLIGGPLASGSAQFPGAPGRPPVWPMPNMSALLPAPGDHRPAAHHQPITQSATGPGEAGPARPAAYNVAQSYRPHVPPASIAATTSLGASGAHTGQPQGAVNLTPTPFGGPFGGAAFPYTVHAGARPMAAPLLQQFHAPAPQVATPPPSANQAAPPDVSQASQQQVPAASAPGVSSTAYPTAVTASVPPASNAHQRQMAADTALLLPAHAMQPPQASTSSEHPHALPLPQGGMTGQITVQAAQPPQGAALDQSGLPAGEASSGPLGALVAEAGASLHEAVAAAPLVSSAPQSDAMTPSTHPPARDVVISEPLSARGDVPVSVTASGASLPAAQAESAATPPVESAPGPVSASGAPSNAAPVSGSAASQSETVPSSGNMPAPQSAPLAADAS